MTAPEPTDAAPAFPGPTARPWYASALLALAGVTLLLLSVWAFARWQSPYPFYGTASQGVRASGFQGVAHTGRPYAFTPGQGGRATALFFGFTHCANICPLTLSYLNKVRDRLSPEEKKQLDIVLVSVDPARDTPERLAGYVPFFGSGTGVRIPEPALGEVARAYGVAYQKVDVKGAGYQINHTTATYLIDRAGRVRVLWDYTQLPQVERVLADVRYVLETPTP
ncbi:SCO family protein [Deinococcus koreensis]|uniref:SCO family protein n=1 Tax=Deinococcus koreensis TaxID=2054903 RepID=UPI001FAF120D|nr:SCO family protein [Deinococcus koreensis]